jgi:hypothetical protein
MEKIGDFGSNYSCLGRNMIITLVFKKKSIFSPNNGKIAENILRAVHTYIGSDPGAKTCESTTTYNLAL